MEILLNPVVVSVILMMALCLLKVNVFVSIVIAALVCGGLGGASMGQTLSVFTVGMSGNNSIVLTMLLFGIVVAAMIDSGVGAVLAPRFSRLAGKRGWLLLIILFALGILSETVIPIGAAFIPIVVPPLLDYANKLKMDRRCIATVMVGGLQIGYVCFPVGFGLAFHQMVQAALADNGLEVELGIVWKCVWIIGVAMILGALTALHIYRKPRDYGDENVAAIVEAAQELTNELPKMAWKHWATIIAAIATIVIQLLTASLPLGALAGVALLLVTGVIRWKDFDTTATKGITGFAFIAFLLMAAAGFAAVSREYGQVDILVSSTVALLGGNKLISAFVMLMLGLIVTMGIGSSFGTVPIVAAIIVPMCLQMGFSASATIMLVATSAALGDAGAPASNQTLLPTASLNLDGKHDHIWDTCIPTFLCYNIPMVIVGSIAATLM